MKLLRTMEPTTRRLRVAKPTALIGFNVFTHTAARGSCNYYIGTGIDHLKPAYRLQKRFRKHIAFVQSIACSQNSHPFCAPTSRQHRTNVVLADLLHEIAIAPLDFRQHQVSNTTLYDDFSKHMGNSFSIIGGIFTPLFLSPHVLTPYTCESAPNFGSTIPKTLMHLLPFGNIVSYNPLPIRHFCLVIYSIPLCTMTFWNIWGTYTLLIVESLHHCSFSRMF